MSLWPFAACLVHRDYLPPFLVVVLAFAFFGSYFAEDKLLVLGLWSFQASIFCKSCTFIVFSGSPVPFLGPAHLGLTPPGSFSRVARLFWFPARQGLTPLGSFSFFLL